MKRNHQYALALLSILIVAIALAYTASAEHRWGANYFPNIELTTQDGKTVHFYDDLIKGKTVAINLIYTHCEYACPLETARLVQVQKLLGDQMGRDIFFYSISIDPKRDTPPVMKKYMESYHVGPGWTFLTGKKEDIDFLSRKLGLYSAPQESRDGHTPHLLIGNEPMGQWMRTSAIDNPAFLARTITDVLETGKYRNPSGEKNYAEASAMKFDTGQYLFARHCAACHSIGHGDKIGPDLMGVADARNRDWLIDIIERPQQLLRDKDPLAAAEFEKYNHVIMPDLSMGREATEALIRFLVTQSSLEARRLSRDATGSAKAAESASPNTEPK
jgi:protein SCO1